MGTWKMRPKEVFAESPLSWAATLSSWSKSSDRIPNNSIREIVNLVRNSNPQAVTSDGGLNGEVGIKTIKEIFRLKHKITTLDLTQDVLGSLLKKSYVLIIYKENIADFLWSTALCYGVDNFNLCYMDPALGKRDCARIRNFGTGGSFKVLLWREKHN